MTPEQARTLIGGGETLNVEFKGERVRSLNDNDLVEALVCLANRPGNDPAWLLVGVEDDGQISGARPRHGHHTNPLRLQALIAGNNHASVKTNHASVNNHAAPRSSQQSSDMPIARFIGRTPDPTVPPPDLTGTSPFGIEDMGAPKKYKPRSKRRGQP